MNTVPWLSILLDRYPTTHPHSWDDVDLAEYASLCEGMPIDSWVKLDNELFSRTCDINGCDDPVHGVMRTYTNFDAADYLDEGNPADWEAEQWTFFARICERVSKTTMDLMQDEVAKRVSGEWSLETDAKQGIRAKYLADLLPKPTSEWEAPKDWDLFKHYLEHREELAEAQDDKDMEDVINGMNDDTPIMTPAPPVSDKKCTCNGPGHAVQKFNDHTQYCPANPDKPKTGSGIVVVKKGDPCLDSCKGPGHPNNPKDDKGNPKSPYNSHTINCPQHPNFKPGSSTTSSYASCKHDRKAKPFKLLNGLEIKAISYRDEKNVDDEETDIGVYLYSSWWWYGNNYSPAVRLSPDFKTQPAWMKKVAKGKKEKKEPLLTQQVVLDWPDFNVPSEALPMVDIVQWMLQQMEQGKRLETACMGGHGRTGTMLALLLVAQGMPPGSAIARVRKYHCKKGIENEKQGRYVAEFYKLVHGNEDWKKTKSQRQLFNKEVNSGHKDNKSKSSSKSSKSSGSVTPVKVTYPTPKYDPEMKLYWSEKFIPGYRKDEKTGVYISEFKDGEPPVWDEEHKLWTHKGYHPNFEWNKSLNCYTSAHKNGQPSASVGAKA